MALSNTTTLNDLVGEIVSEQSVTAAYAARVMRPLVTGRIVPPGNASIVIPRWDIIAVNALTEGVAPTSETASTTGVTLAPDERGVFVEVSKKVLYADPWQDLAPYGDQIGRAMAADEDKQILTEIEANYSEAVGSAGDPLNLTSFRAALSTLEANNAPGPYFAVFHPYAWANLRAELSDASAFAGVGAQTVTGFGPGFTQNAGFVGQPYGIPCFISSQVSDSSSLVFSQQAVAAAWMNDIRIDVDDNIVSRKIDIMAWYTIDAKLLKEEWIVGIDHAAGA